MLEQTEDDGQWKPYVMDFGLVREQDSAGVTVSGMTMGTPAYMSPEQAIGDIHRLDRRTDVYSLGATLYELLSGHLPLGECMGMEMVRRAIDREPVPLHKVAPGIPRDLETIVMKCLEKEPERRYDSARAFAEDLQSYLDGTEIKARPISLFHRLYKRAKRQKAISITFITALIIVLATIGYGLHLKWQANYQAKITQEIGQKTGKIDSILSKSYLMPLHNTQKEKKIVEDMVEEIKNLGNEVKLAEGPSKYAIGRAYLELNDLSKARNYLEEAWNVGYQNADVVHALGMVFGRLYQRELQQAEHIQKKEQREARIQEIEREYRQPALEFLKKSQGSNAAEQAYIKAQIAYFEKQYEEALTKTKMAYKEMLELYKARQLEADIYVQLGNEKKSTGLYDETKKYYEQAENSYDEAIKIGRSDASIYEGLCNLQLLRMGLPQINVEEYFKKGLHICEQALQGDPESVGAYSLQSSLLYRMGYLEMRLGKDPRDSLLRSIEKAWQALRIQPKHAEAYKSMGEAYKNMAEFKMNHGEDPRDSLKKAINALQNAIEINPNDDRFHDLLGRIHKTYAQYDMTRGNDPQESMQKSIVAYQKATEIRPDFAGAYNNLGNAYFYDAEYKINYGKDARDSLKNAINAFQKTINLNPHNSNSYLNMGNPYLLQATFEIEQGEDPRDSVRMAVQSYQKAIEMNHPYLNMPYNNLAEAYQVSAMYELEKGLDARASLENAKKFCQEALTINPNLFYHYLAQGRLGILESRWQKKQGKNPDDVINQAHQTLEKAVQLNPESADTYCEIGELYRWQAEFLITEKRSATKEIT
ncbi:MAG: hypothetical protein A2Y62_08130, partial [Candidatus Fischerbacteria bacterium RBG_13_37_8]